MENKYSFDQFCEIIAQLRAEDGCPWDKEQTHASLKQCLIEEAYEVIEGIDRYEANGEFDNLREELGDVLLQVVMHSQIAKEEGLFTVADVIDEIARKMVRRHPHVFSDVKVDGSEALLQNWEAIKKEEKREKSEKDTLHAIPNAFPALIRAQKVIKKSEKLYGTKKNEDTLVGAMNPMSDLEQKIVADASEDEIAYQFGKAMFQMCKFAETYHLNSEKCLSDYVKIYISKMEDETIRSSVK